jgi:hypothetical protein
VKNLRRLGAATVASCLSLLATLGLAGAIDASQETGASAQPPTSEKPATAKRAPGAPTRLVVIRRPTRTDAPAGTIYVQPPSNTSVAAPPAPVPAAPTTRSS